MTLDVAQEYKNRQDEAVELSRRHLNPQFYHLRKAVGLDIDLVRGEGVWMYDRQDRRYLDMAAGLGVFLIGRNHPTVKRALHGALDGDFPSLTSPILHTMSSLVAERLTAHAPHLSRVFFCNSGSEAAEAALKFARYTTKRHRLVYCSGGFHGMSFGALSVNGNEIFRQGFGPLLADTTEVPFGDADALRAALSGGDVAAFIVEPIQGFGVFEAPIGYWSEVERLCREHGALLIIDEVQTGGGRTGRFYAFQHVGIEPDMVMVSKALSGGLVPVGAVLCRPEIYEAIYGLMLVHTPHWSTYSENTLAMVAAWAALGVIEEERLMDRAAAIELRFRERVERMSKRFHLVRGLRGKGAMLAIDLEPVPGPLRVALSLLEQHRILAWAGGPLWKALKILPPLVVQDAEIDIFCDALEKVLEQEDL